MATKKRAKETFARFDAADYLETAEDIVGYLEACMEEGGDERFVLAARPLQELAHGDHLIERKGDHHQHGETGDQRGRAPCSDHDRLNDDEID